MNVKYVKTFLVVVVIFFSVAIPRFILAEDPPCDAGRICNPLANKNINTIDDFIPVILEGVIKIAIPVIALAIIYSGFLFVAARGNPEKITGAKDALLYTLVGAAILLGAWAIAKLISETVLAL